MTIVYVIDMSADPDKDIACAPFSLIPTEKAQNVCDNEISEKNNKKIRTVSFPADDQLVTQYCEPENPWKHVPATNRAQIAADYLELCRRYNTTPIDSVLQLIRELPESCIGGGTRAPRLTLCECLLLGPAPVDALEAVLRRVQFRRLELDHAILDDEGAEALFDMIEYYESAVVVSISGPRQFGIRGWQAASRMIKKSADLTELEVTEGPLEASHAPTIARALRTHTCRIRALCLQRASLCGEPLLSLVIALKSNSSIRELRLGDNNLSSSDAVQLASLLRYNTNIQLLDLSNNQIQDSGVGHIADALVEQAALTPPSAVASPLSPVYGQGHEVRGLSFLVLWNNQLTRNCAVHLSKALRGCSSLCVLNIGRNAVGGDAVRAARAGSSLASLGLQAARLGPDAAPALACLIADTRLQRLDLRDNKLGSVGLRAILNALRENTTLTQIDLDDQADSPDSLPAAEDQEAATVSRLTREIRALCRRNEPVATEPTSRTHRKISLTCNTTTVLKSSLRPEEERRACRLRSPAPSPAPSPAGSPVPTIHAASRFSVTRVTPERDPRDSPSPGTIPGTDYPTPSRFKVVQVVEPLQVQIDAASTQRRPPSRFSVTRNYDTTYDPQQRTPEKTQTDTQTNKTDRDETPIESTAVEAKTEDLPKALAVEAVNVTRDAVRDVEAGVDEAKFDEFTDSNRRDESKNEFDNITVIEFKRNIQEIIGRSETIEVHRAEDEAHAEADSDRSTTSENVIGKTFYVSTVSGSVCDEEVTGSPSRGPGGRPLSRLFEVRRVPDPRPVVCDNATDISAELNVETDKIEDGLIRDVTIGECDSECDGGSVLSENAPETDASGHAGPAGPADVDETIKRVKTIKQIEILTEDLGNIINEMKVLSMRNQNVLDSECVNSANVPANLVIKKIKSELSPDSSDIEVSMLMSEKLADFRDSSSSLEISGGSVESLNEVQRLTVRAAASDDDGQRPERVLSAGSSVESANDVTPVNYLNTSLSSNESASPVFGKKIHGSLSSLEASVSSIDSVRQEKLMVTSADSGIEYSLQNPTEPRDDVSSNEGTLTNNSSLRDTKKNPTEETLTSSPKRASSLMDVPALKSKGLERARKKSWVAPSSSFQVPRPEADRDSKPSHLEKLLSIFQHPTSIFSRSSQSDDERKSASNTPPRKDSSLTSSFWTWGSSIDKDKDEKDDSSSEATDSTLSERIQVSFVDESFSKRLDSKTPSTDTDNTLSEFQSFAPQISETTDATRDAGRSIVTAPTTDDNLVQKIDLSKKDPNANGNRVSSRIDLRQPNEINKNIHESVAPCTEGGKNPGRTPGVIVKDIKIDDTARPRTFAAVLKSSGSENSLEKQSSPDPGQTVDKLPSKVIRGIKENISPENTLTSNTSTTRALAIELTEKQMKCQPLINAAFVSSLLEKSTADEAVGLAPIAVIDETCDESADAHIQLEYIDADKLHARSGVVCLEGFADPNTEKITQDLEAVDLGKDALAYLAYESQDFEPDANKQSSLAEELQQAELKEIVDLSPELIVDEALEIPDVFTAKEMKGLRASPVIPDRAKLKKSNSLEDLSQLQSTDAEKSDRKTKTIAFKIPESTPKDIPQRRTKLRSRSGSSPKSLPESLNKPCPLTKMDSLLTKKKKKVSSLGKMARDSLLALNMSEEEIAEFRRSYKLTSVESLRSLESVSEDANSQSGNSVDSRCRSCLRTSQESLMSLDSMTEECNCDKGNRSAR